MTVGELRRALGTLADAADVVVYADWQGAGERPFGLLDERLYVCGYFAVAALEREGGDEPAAARGVLLLGQEVP